MYFPATHGMHLYPSGPDWPALHVQFVKVVLPTEDMEFSGHATHLELAESPTAEEYVAVAQSMHRADPSSDLYFPATHSAHTAGGPVEPGLHVHNGSGPL